MKTILEPQDPAYGRLRLRAQRMVGLWLSLNVLSFQTSLETWTTAAIINWKRSPKGDSCGWSRAKGKESPRPITASISFPINNVIAAVGGPGL